MILSFQLFINYLYDKTDIKIKKTLHHNKFMGKLPKLTKILITIGDTPLKTLHKYSLHFVLLQRISWQTVCTYTDIYYITMYTVSKDYYIFPLKSSSSLRVCQREKPEVQLTVAPLWQQQLTVNDAVTWYSHPIYTNRYTLYAHKQL